jgi:hypothetical protein
MSHRFEEGYSMHGEKNPGLDASKLLEKAIDEGQGLSNTYENEKSIGRTENELSSVVGVVGVPSLIRKQRALIESVIMILEGEKDVSKLTEAIENCPLLLCLFNGAV